MDIRVAGHQVDAGAAFRTHVETRLTSMADKYFSRAIRANVTLSQAPHSGFAVDIVMHVMHDLILKGSGHANDAHPAFDIAADRIDKQLRRYMRRLKDRHGPSARPVAPDDGPFDNAAYTIFAVPADDASDHPPVIAETRVDVPEASVGDAVMMLDLRNTTALLFKNTKSGIHNMVYRREDGSIGWVEPQG